MSLLNDKDNKVIALSGKWGTGKSHLWRDVQSASGDEAVKGALYVSLFGLSDMHQVTKKLVQNLLSNKDKHSAVLKSAGVFVDGAKKVLTSIHSGFSALDELALLAVPRLLKDKVIVLDDIERKHEKLSIDEVLGFIDEFTQQYCTRFVLILNSDKLSNRENWDTLHEKVVDQEIRLSTSTDEAFDIAIGLAPSPYAIQIRAASVACRLTNIRIILRVIKATNRILGNRVDLSDALLARVVPSTVLLAGVHFKGIEDGPDFEFILEQGTPSDWGVLKDKNQIENVDYLRKSRWKLLLNELGIHMCNDYEQLVIEFLQSGLFDATNLAAIIGKYATENDAMSARNELRHFFNQLNWEHRLTEADLLAQAKALAPRIYLIDAYSFTAFLDVVEGLPDGHCLASAMLNDWIKAFTANDFEDLDDRNLFGRTVHPAIQAEFDKLKSNAQTEVTIFDAIKFIVENNGWNTRQELAMKAATVGDFEAIIKTKDIDGLRIVMSKMLEMTIESNSYGPHFKQATDRFVEACKNMARDHTSGRLGKIIRRHFNESKAGHFLEEPPISAGVASSHDGMTSSK